MAIKGQSLTINLYAFNITDNLPASGLTDISGYVIKDGASPSALTNAVSEPSATNVPGIYEVTLSSSEMDANWITVAGKSQGSPTDVVVYPVMIATEQGHFDNISGKLPNNYIMGSSVTTNQDDNIANIETYVQTISGYTDSLETGQTTIQNQNTGISTQVSGLPNIDTIVSSGDTAGWGATSSLTKEAIAGEVVLSGNSAGWSDGATAAEVWAAGARTLTDYHEDEIASEVVTSGNIENWNQYSDATLSNQTEMLSRILNVSGTLDNKPNIDTIVSSGNAEGWGATSSLTKESIAGEVVLSGNAANWSGVADVSSLALQSTLLFVSGDLSTKPNINTIVSSGTAAGWDTAYSNVNVSSIAPSALSQIVDSGNAANWNSTTQVGAIVSGIFDEVVNGTKDYRTAFEEIWSYAIGDINASGASPYKHTYKDMTDSNLFTLNISGQGRTRS